MKPGTYPLGTGRAELERLDRQHAVWRGDSLAAWDRAGFGAGQRLLDLGCGPGFAALDLAARVGSEGAVLAIDNAGSYLEHLREQARCRGLAQLAGLRFDLAGPLSCAAIDAAIGRCCWDGAWCRWLAMFLPDPAALVAVVARALRPGGRLVLHEYVQWDTFALHPRGEGLRRFVRCCIGDWQAHGLDPHVARRLPPLLEGEGLRLVSARSLMACQPGSGAKALWLQDFLHSYAPRLAAQGLWSADDQRILDADLAWAAAHPSLWVTPALVEQIWERPAPSPLPSR